MHIGNVPLYGGGKGGRSDTIQHRITHLLERMGIHVIQTRRVPDRSIQVAELRADMGRQKIIDTDHYEMEWDVTLDYKQASEFVVLAEEYSNTKKQVIDLMARCDSLSSELTKMKIKMVSFHDTLDQNPELKADFEEFMTLAKLAGFNEELV